MSTRSCHPQQLTDRHTATHPWPKILRSVTTQLPQQDRVTEPPQCSKEAPAVSHRFCYQRSRANCGRDLSVVLLSKKRCLSIATVDLTLTTVAQPGCGNSTLVTFKVLLFPIRGVMCFTFSSCCHMLLHRSASGFNAARAVFRGNWSSVTLANFLRHGGCGSQDWVALPE